MASSALSLMWIMYCEGRRNKLFQNDVVERSLHKFAHLLYSLETPFVDEKPNEVDALLICCDLNLQITLRFVVTSATGATGILGRFLYKDSP